MTRVRGLFKFGKREFLEEFCTQGKLFMNPLSYFITLENDTMRADRSEGTYLTFPPSAAQILIENASEFKPIPNRVGPLRVSRGHDRNVNIFCMYALLHSEPQTFVDSHLFEFGEYVVLVKNGDEFLRRVRKALTPDGQIINYKLVEYVDPETHAGEMGVFRKFSFFQRQSEFRIAMLPGTGDDFSLSVGDLTDITVIGRSEELNDHLGTNGDGEIRIRHQMPGS